jgi:hypothetical protein
MSTDMPPNKPWKAKHSSLTWSAASTKDLHNAVAAITGSGNAVMFSRTMDGSALVLSIFSGNNKAKEFVTDPGDIPSLLTWAVEEFS